MSDMVKIGSGGSNLEITKLIWNTRGARKVGVLRRKASGFQKGKVYESPRIVLDRHYKDFTGKRYKAYRGKAVVEHDGWGSMDAWQQEGDCIVLFFPDKWNAPKTEEQE